MKRSGTQHVLGFLVGLTILVGSLGCAHTPTQPVPVSDSVISQLGTIGVVVLPTAPEAIFHAPDTGIGPSAGRGAALGSELMELGGGCGVGIIICVPALAAVGAIGGAVYGVAASEPASQWTEARSAFRAILEQETVADRVPQQLVAFAQQHGFDMRVVPLHSPQDHSAGSQYATLAEEGIATVLELGDLRVLLKPAAFEVNPPRRLFASVHVRLIRALDNAVLDDRTVVDKLAGTRHLSAWTEDHTQPFREEAAQAVERLAKQVIEELFWHDPMQERCEGWLLQRVCFVGPKPLYPLLTTDNSIPEIQALRPVLRWEPSHASDVTYDLMIWRAEGLNQGVLVYSRERLPESSHRLESSLQPDKTYYWTVRARFTSEGRIRITPWGSQRDIHVTYFAFRTPTNLR